MALDKLFRFLACVDKDPELIPYAFTEFSVHQRFCDCLLQHACFNGVARFSKPVD